MSNYPQHERLKEVQPQSQAIHQFLLEFAAERGLFLAKRLPYEVGEDYEQEERIVPAHDSVTKLVAEFLEIDLDALENEKQAMLKEISG